MYFGSTEDGLCKYTLCKKAVLCILGVLVLVLFFLESRAAFENECDFFVQKREVETKKDLFDALQKSNTEKIVLIAIRKLEPRSMTYLSYINDRILKKEKTKDTKYLFILDIESLIPEQRDLVQALELSQTPSIFLLKKDKSTEYGFSIIEKTEGITKSVETLLQKAELFDSS